MAGAEATWEEVPVCVTVTTEARDSAEAEGRNEVECGLKLSMGSTCSDVRRGFEGGDEAPETCASGSETGEIVSTLKEETGCWTDSFFLICPNKHLNISANSV